MSLEDPPGNDDLISWKHRFVQGGIVDGLDAVNDQFLTIIGPVKFHLFLVGKISEPTGGGHRLHHRHFTGVNISVGTADIAVHKEKSVLGCDRDGQLLPGLLGNIKIVDIPLQLPDILACSLNPQVQGQGQGTIILDPLLMPWRGCGDT